VCVRLRGQWPSDDDSCCVYGGEEDECCFYGGKDDGAAAARTIDGADNGCCADYDIRQRTWRGRPCAMVADATRTMAGVLLGSFG